MKYLLFLFGIVLLSSCAQLSSFQTGRTLGKDNNRITAAVHGFGVSGEPGSLFEGNDLILPFAEVMGQFGISDRFDLGIKLSTSANAQGHAKYQFVGSLASKFAISLGGGLSYQWADEETVFRAHVPLYLSYHPSEKGAIYATPRYIYQIVVDDNNAYFLGGSLGYSHQFSNRFTGFLEGSAYFPKVQNESNDNSYIYQFGIGGGWSF